MTIDVFKDRSRTRMAEQYVAPVRAALAGDDLPGLFVAALAQGMALLARLIVLDLQAAVADPVTDRLVPGSFTVAIDDREFIAVRDVTGIVQVNGE